MVLIHKNIAIIFGVVGIFQLCFGITIVVCSTIFAVNASVIITPYWSGVPIVIVGAIGIVCWVTRNKCLLTTSLVFNLILFIIMVISVWLLALSLDNYVLASSYFRDHNCQNISGDCYCTEETYKGIDCDYMKSIVIILKLTLAVSILGSIVSFVGIILGCAGLCCCQANESPVAILHNQQVVITQQSAEGFPPGIITYQPYYINQMPPPYSEVQENDKQVVNRGNSLDSSQSENYDPTAQVNPAYGFYIAH